MDFETIRQQQKETWDKFSPGWKKWDEYTMNFLAPMGAAIIQSLHLKSSDHVLDVATGTGEPGLSIARIVSGGKVTGTDLSDGMLAVAKERAGAQSIENYETVVSDVTELPFADNTFDAISCRFGFMFFPDMQRAAKELARILKPGGRIAIAVWGEPKDNVWVTVTMGTIYEIMNIPKPPPDAPGMFRCAAPGFMESLLKNAGFKNISGIESSGIYDFLSVEMYWSFNTEVAAGVVAALAQATPEQRELVHAKVLEKIHQLNPGGGAKLSYGAHIISAEK